MPSQKMFFMNRVTVLFNTNKFKLPEPKYSVDSQGLTTPILVWYSRQQVQNVLASILLLQKVPVTVRTHQEIYFKGRFLCRIVSKPQSLCVREKLVGNFNSLILHRLSGKSSKHCLPLLDRAEQLHSLASGLLLIQ